MLRLLLGGPWRTSTTVRSCCTRTRWLGLAMLSVSPSHRVSWHACIALCGYPSSSALSPRPSRYGGAHVAAARGWRRCTCSPHRCGVVLLCISRACDAQGPEQGLGQGPVQEPVQEVLLVCPVPLASSVRALRSPAVLRLSDQALIPVVSTPID